MGAALRSGQHLFQTLLHGGFVAFVQGQFGLADEARQGRAQLVRSVVQKAFLFLLPPRHRSEQTVDRAGQRMHFLRRRCQLDGCQRVGAAVRAGACLFDLRFQPLERLQAPQHAGVHQRT
ncbi:hypothetical protein D3C86_1664800 [compost metagenome]